MVLAAMAGCGRDREEAPSGAKPRVVVYSALDREFSEPVLKTYAAQAGVELLPKFDVESTKTVGLTNLIIAEASQPRCDLFWNNEILNTLRLKEKGLLAPFHTSHDRELPETFKAKDATWYGFAARARILIVNTKLVAEADRPKGLGDLVTIVYPDREPDALGTLFIPNTLVVPKGAPHAQAAEALADYLLSPEVEGTLATGPSAQIPLLASTNVKARVETPKTVHAMDVDFEAAAKIWDRVAEFLAGEFAGP
jgi:ABC-type Fe3+ transport system substrate-binding protein